MKIKKVLNNYVIAKQEASKEKKIGSIIIPEVCSIEDVQKTEIIYKSDNCHKVDVGEIVVSHIGRGTKFMLGELPVIALDEVKDLICVVDE